MRRGFGRSFALFAQLVQGTLERSRAFLDALDDETEPEKRTGSYAQEEAPDSVRAGAS